MALSMAKPVPRNIAPVAVDDTGFSTIKATDLTIQTNQLTANDTDANGDALSVTGVKAGRTTHGTVTLSADHTSVLFHPDATYTGNATFNYTLSDGHKGTDTAT